LSHPGPKKSERWILIFTSIYLGLKILQTRNAFFPFHMRIMWPSLVKIQYTELKLSCRKDSVFKNSIYSNGDLDLWPNDPKINRVFPLTQGNHVAKFVKDPIYRTKVIVRKRLLSKILFIVTVTLTFDLMTPK
jgi:hypothetical protein